MINIKPLHDDNNVHTNMKKFAYKNDFLRVICLWSCSETVVESTSTIMKLLAILSVTVALSHGLIRIPSQKELNAFIRSVPRFPTRQISVIPPLPTLHTEYSRPIRGVFKPLEGCSVNKTLNIWDYGTIQTPNYPEDYPSDTACEWVIEGPPGSRIEATVFDLETQAWFLGYYDYVAFSLTGDFETVDQFAGDANSKTPFLVKSIENKLGVRFKSNGFINYRGLKLGYVVRPANESTDNGYQVSNDDGVCGRSFVIDTVTEGSTDATEPTTSLPEETTSAPEETTSAQEETTAAPEETTAGTGTEENPRAAETLEGEDIGTKIIGHTPAPKGGVIHFKLLSVFY